MIFQKEINGIHVDAVYSEESVQTVFIPLLQHLTNLQKEKGRRILVMLAAPPAAGKSTLLAFLHDLAHNTEDITELTTIGMDGFHRYQEYLLTHTMMREGQEVPMVTLKGAPETFDLEKLDAAVKRFAHGESFGWPDYNRMLHNPVENSQTIEGDIVLLEGNYLLLNWPGWKDLHKMADYTIQIIADEADLRERLIARKMASGTAEEEAVHFVETSDLYNARTCLNHSLPSDLTLRLNHNGDYEIHQKANC